MSRNANRTSVKDMVDLFENQTKMEEYLKTKTQVPKPSRSVHSPALGETLRNLLEIKRPNKSPNSSTLPTRKKYSNTQSDKSSLQVPVKYKSSSNTPSPSTSFRRQYSLPTKTKLSSKTVPNIPQDILDDIAANNDLVDQFGERLKKNRKNSKNATPSPTVSDSKSLEFHLESKKPQSGNEKVKTKDEKSKKRKSGHKSKEEKRAAKEKNGQLHKSSSTSSRKSNDKTGEADKQKTLDENAELYLTKSKDMDIISEMRDIYFKKNNKIQVDIPVFVPETLEKPFIRNKYTKSPTDRRYKEKVLLKKKIEDSQQRSKLQIGKEQYLYGNNETSPEIILARRNNSRYDKPSYVLKSYEFLEETKKENTEKSLDVSAYNESISTRDNSNENNQKTAILEKNQQETQLESTNSPVEVSNQKKNIPLDKFEVISTGSENQNLDIWSQAVTLDIFETPPTQINNENQEQYFEYETTELSLNQIPDSNEEPAEEFKAVSEEEADKTASVDNETEIEQVQNSVAFELNDMMQEISSITLEDTEIVPEAEEKLIEEEASVDKEAEIEIVRKTAICELDEMMKVIYKDIEYLEDDVLLQEEEEPLPIDDYLEKLRKNTSDELKVLPIEEAEPETISTANQTQITEECKPDASVLENVDTYDLPIDEPELGKVSTVKQTQITEDSKPEQVSSPTNTDTAYPSTSYNVSLIEEPELEKVSTVNQTQITEASSPTSIDTTSPSTSYNDSAELEELTETSSNITEDTEEIDGCWTPFSGRNSTKELMRQEPYDFGELICRPDNFVEAFNDHDNELVITELQLTVVRKRYSTIGHSETDTDNEIIMDEGISMSIDEEVVLRKHEPVDENVRRETIRDPEGNIRIDRVGYDQSAYHENDDQLSPVTTLDRRGQVFYIIEELKNTEKNYVDILDKIVNKYMPYVHTNTPDHLLGKSCYMFSNIESLYVDAKNFLADLLQSDEDVDSIADIFVKYQYMFKKYPIYLRNKPIADNYIKEFHQVIKQLQHDTGEKLDLAADLLTPFQRLGKYILLLENMKKELLKKNKPTENIVKAIDVVKTEMTKGNDAVAMDSITGCPFALGDYSPFIMRDKFVWLKNKKIDLMVFLFEKIIVFTSINHKNMERFPYLDSIRLDDLTITSQVSQPTLIELTDYTKSKKTSVKYTYLLESKSEKTKQNWSMKIEQILWKQLEKVKVEASHSVSYMPMTPTKRDKKSRDGKTKSIFYLK